MPRARMPAEVRARLAASLPPESPARGSDRIAEQIRRWIFDGVLHDGDVVSQEDLAALLGVSRIPVRDALISLSTSGWVLLERGVGARAIGLDRAAVHDTLTLMGTIWSLLAGRAVERGAPTASITASGGRVKQASADEMTEANAAFVRELRALAGSPRLDAAFRNAARIVPGDFFEVVPGAVEQQRRHVPGIATSIARGDVARAGELALALHQHHARSITKLLAARGALTTATGGAAPRA